ncbi:MAG: DUF86 domain-containing protein [Deltaproteobacteria bacterium]|nr:MAG: DUF86 domain-containing protein [Deltaproteobacteria bacterium]
MSQPKDLIRLQHMLDYAREALELMQGKPRNDLDSDRLLGLALVRLMEMIGEAANRVSPEYQSAHASIPWSQIISLRNRLIHGYDAVDMDILWEILGQDLPGLVAELESVILRESGT